MVTHHLNVQALPGPACKSPTLTCISPLLLKSLAGTCTCSLIVIMHGHLYFSALRLLVGLCYKGALQEL